VELRQLRYFLAVAEEGRFRRAAQRLHIAAPSLSQQIRALEGELHVRLFERTPQAVRLTPAGVVFAERARVILAEVERARVAVRTAGASSREQLILRVAHMADLVLESPLRRVALGIAGLEVSVSACPGDDALEAVRQDRADVAVVWKRSYAQRDLPGATLGSVVFGIALPLKHASRGALRVPVAALAADVLVMLPRAPFAGVWEPTVDHIFPEGAARDRVHVEPNLIDAPRALLRAVAAGEGVAVCIMGIAEGLGIEDVAIRPLDPVLRWGLEVVWRAPAAPATRSLVDFLIESARDPKVLIEQG
jgi:DNA-binding transcriptional LysR family regulator